MSFFKTYDMRGTYGVDFDLDTVYRVGKNLPKVIKGRRFLVGRDCRLTSPAVRDSLVQGLLDAGVEVVDMGLATTPMVYFFTATEDFDGSIMVTASHNPPSDNGLKVSKKTSLPVGYADGLDEVERLVSESAEGANPGAYKGIDAVDEERLERYLDWMLKANPALEDINRELNFAIDCSNGMASILVKRLFPNALIINDTMDGSFPAHSPNPLDIEARRDISKLVAEKSLDCGIIFDGDADRAMFVDERGNFVQPDYLIAAVAQATAAVGGRGASSGVKVIHDVRTSRGVIEELERLGFEPLMVPVGHAFAKPILRERQAMCGGELAGHYYFSEFFGCDSAVLAAIRILSEILRHHRRSERFSTMIRRVSERYANSGELNFTVPDKDLALQRILQAANRHFPRQISSSDIDGVRVEYADGWINVRKSNTEPYLRVIAEFASAEVLDERLKVIKNSLQGRSDES